MNLKSSAFSFSASLAVLLSVLLPARTTFARSCAARVAKVGTVVTVPSETFSPAMRRFIKSTMDVLFHEKHVRTLEGKSADEWAKTIEWWGDGNTLNLRTPRGEYSFRIASGTRKADLGQRVPHIDDVDIHLHLKGRIYLHPDWLTEAALQNKQHLFDLIGFARAAFRGDEYLCPHLGDPRYPGEAKRLSLVQEDLFDPMVAAYNAHLAAAGDGTCHRVAGVSSGGSGKTVVNGQYLWETVVRRSPDGNYFIAITVPDNDNLEGVIEDIVEELGLRDDQVARMFGQKSTPKLLAQHKVVFISRQNLHSKQDEIFRFARGKRTAIFVDEAHHVGTEDGQYREVLLRAKRELTKEDQVVLASATLWYDLDDNNQFIDEFVGRNIFVALMTPAERERYINDKSSRPALSMALLLRTMRQGVLAPFRNIQMEIGHGDVSLLNDIKRYLADTDDDVAELDDMIIRAVAAKMVDFRNRHPFRVVRAGVFTNRTTRATRFSKTLQEVLDDGNFSQDIYQVHSYHTGPESFKDTVLWLGDKKDVARGKDYTGDWGNPDRRVHKAVVVDGKLGQGVNFPRLNMAFLIKVYNLLDGARRVYQNLVRIARPSEGKTEAEVHIFAHTLARLGRMKDVLLASYIQDEPQNPDVENPENIAPPDPAAVAAVQDPDPGAAPRPPRQPRRRAQARRAQAAPFVRDFFWIGSSILEMGVETQEPPEVLADAVEEEAKGPATLDTYEVDPFAGDLPAFVVHEVPVGEQREKAIHFLVTQLNPFSDKNGEAGSETAARVVRILERLNQLTPESTNYKVAMAGKPSERQVYLYRCLLILSHYYRGAVRAKEDPDLVDIATREMEEITPRMERHWSNLMESILGMKPETSKKQEVEITIKLDAAKDVGTPAVQWLADMYRKAGTDKAMDWVAGKNEVLMGRRVPGPHQIVMKVSGPEAYDLLRFETGTHSIKRSENGAPYASTITVEVKPVGDTASEVGDWKTHFELLRKDAAYVRRYDLVEKFILLNREGPNRRFDLAYPPESLVTPLTLVKSLGVLHFVTGEKRLLDILKGVDGGMPLDTDLPAAEEIAVRLNRISAYPRP